MPKTVTRILSINIDRHLKTEQKIILGHLTYSASKLWNTSNYEILENKTSIYELKVKLKDNLWYKNLHSQSAQAVIEKLQTAWKNCFKKYIKHPKYRPKDGHLTVIRKKVGIRLITLAIDLGVSSLITATDGGYSMIIDGRTLVSKMRLFAKERTSLQSILSKQKLKTSRRLHNLYGKERNFVNDYLHKTSKKVVDHCLKHRIGTIAIGTMHKGITNMNIGTQNNEKLHRIPFERFVKQIKYKAEEYGIEVTLVNESHTSQTCRICGNVDKSSRKHRGLYVCKKCGSVINADVIGVGVLANPARIRIVNKLRAKKSLHFNADFNT
ncbi:MAG: transposase [Thermotogae bacterium]|nr:transposase [Thermotogota bacterium]